eukprot:Nitzschia sp. Nitz4//scaffold169_size48518//17611//18105//NITZ4_007069-RA/size48518-processed-gene-0.91-mRNA-1//-1//CDS//3329538379//4994//frame0
MEHSTSSSQALPGDSSPPLHKGLGPHDPSRTVRFSADVNVFPVIRRDEMSLEELTNAWTNTCDRTESKRDISSTIFLMRSGLGRKLTEQDFFCPRGLEHLVNKSLQKATVKKSVGIALAMQRLLKKAGASNPQMIARAYRKYTFDSKFVAYKKALRDEAAASKI